MDQNRENINNSYGDSILGKVGKFYDNKIQDAVEMALGVNDVKTMKETGINRYRQAGDLLTSLDNSAITSVNASNLINQIKAHDFTEQASQNFTSDPSQAFGRINPDNTTKSITQ